MIGVQANLLEHAVVGEFFELFKTPWEFYRNDQQYDVLLCTESGGYGDKVAKLVLLYSSHEVPFDAEKNAEIAARRSNTMLSYKGSQIPIYGASITFREKGVDLLVEEGSQQAAMHQHQSRCGIVTRIGYDLFSEVSTLLTVGQPVAYAGIPTLDLHIALLRDLIVANGIPLVEIPPVPDGYQFIACLTHDVDHPSIVLYKWDYTMFGFLYRAVFGSFGNFFRGRMPFRNLLANLGATLKLPFVYMGFARDYWRGFDDRYLEVEKGICSTFFVVPFKDRRGRNSHGLAPKLRATRYGASDIAETIEKVMSAGCEVGLHGIDAWCESSSGREELEEIRRLTGISEIGVRMHWLYYDRESPAILERAEADYDSTIGYNETVGYRAGTTQVYKPLLATRLMELPMHIMDTALFYPAYLGLSPRKAKTILNRMVDNVALSGGCITINWHDRSLAPERLWDACYLDLVEDLKSRDAWFATARQATLWFRKRRSVVFGTDPVTDALRDRDSADHGDSLPGLQLRTYNAPESSRIGDQDSELYADVTFEENADAPLSCSRR